MSKKRAIGLHDPNTRFLLDTNVFIAASKSGWTRTTDLVLRLVNGEEVLTKILIIEALPLKIEE
jgi:hypothetical protein